MSEQQPEESISLAQFLASVRREKLRSGNKCGIQILPGLLEEAASRG
jgi:hypothetical protein